MSRFLLIIFTVIIISGCSATSITMQITEIPVSAPIATPTITPELTPEPTPVPTPALIPEPAAQVSMPEPSQKITESAKPETTASGLDFSKLNYMDSTRIPWGVVLKGNQLVPEISYKTQEILKRYNGFYTGDTAQKKVYLIFSAGYEGGYTNSILDTLKKNDVKAVFFLVGDYIKKNKELVKRMLDEGHLIGNHSMSHKCLPEVDDSILESEIGGLEKYFTTEFGKSFKYFMPPSGEYSEKVLAAAQQMGYKSIFWSFAYLDFDTNNQKGADYAYNKVIDNLHNGAFIFLHTVSKDNAEAMDRIIKEIRNRGYDIGLLDV